MKIVAIGGCSGAGKSYLARALRTKLADSSLLELDAYYWPQAHLPFTERERTNYDHPDSLEWPLLVQHLKHLAEGNAVDGPVYRFDQHTRADATQRIPAGDVLLVEGILALYHPGVRMLADVKVFVHTSADACFERRITRDLVERGRSEASVREQYQQTVLPMAQAFVLPSRQFADLVVSGEDPVDAAVRQIEDLLRRI